MRHRIVVLAAFLVVTGISAGGDNVPLRYRGLSGPLSLTVKHEIEIRPPGADPIEANRELDFRLSAPAGPGDQPVTLVVDRASASSAAHGMTQRLGTRHLKGRSFGLTPAEGGRRLAPAGGNEPLAIDLGPMVPGGLPIVDVLADALPVLPEGPISAGTTWQSERTVLTLEGWAWATGRLRTRHRITGIENQGGSTVVTVSSEGEADLGPVEGGRDYAGKLSRTVRWSFDASSGLLLSLELEQKTDAESDLKAPGTRVLQGSRLALAPAGDGSS